MKFKIVEDKIHGRYDLYSSVLGWTWDYEHTANTVIELEKYAVKLAETGKTIKEFEING